MVTREEEPLKAQQKEKRSLREKYQHLKENITVEPVLACYVVPGALSRLATQNLNLDKACRVNIQYGDEICEALVARKGNYHAEEKVVQEFVAGMDIWKNILQTSIPCFIILFLGAWSDREKKRKLCILLPIFGDLLMCLSNIVNVYFFYELPVEVTVFFEAFFPAITGGWIAIYMGAFSYISDVSSEESRTFRVGVANLCLTAGSPIGSALSGILLNHIGYYGVFSVSSALYLFSLFYVLLYIKDPQETAEKKEKRENSSCFGFLKSFFAVKHVKDTVTVAFKKGPNRRRTKSILILLGIFFIYGPSYGEFTIRYLFCRSRFNWDALKYSFYHTFSICMHAVGAVISISVFSRRLGWDDSVLVIISTVSHIAGTLAVGFARNTAGMYLAVVIETFNASAFTAMRSISSKLVSSDELGKMISVFNLMEMVTSMVFGPIYAWIYMMTIRYNAGVAFYISSVLTLIPVGIFTWFYNQNSKARRKKKNEKLNQMKSEPTKEETQV